MEDHEPVRIEGDTIVDAFRNTVHRIPNRPALRRKVAGRWQTLTWADYGRGVGEVTAGLAEFGIEPGQQVGIFSNNRLEWHLADFGVLANGSVTVPLYQTSSAEQVEYILGHAQARAASSRTTSWQAGSSRCAIGCPTSSGSSSSMMTSGSTIRSSWASSRCARSGRRGLQIEPDVFDRRADAVAPEQLATLVYTSGTTGPPKGAMIDHANIMWTIRSAASVVHVREGERFLSFLPLSHIAERMISDFLSVAIGGDTWFARSLATVAEDLRDCHPTVFFAVPRVWEKFQEGALAKLDDEHGLKKLVIDRYVGLGQHVVAEHETVQRAPVWERLPYEALDAVVGARSARSSGSTRPTSS